MTTARSIVRRENIIFIDEDICVRFPKDVMIADLSLPNTRPDHHIQLLVERFCTGQEAMIFAWLNFSALVFYDTHNGKKIRGENSERSNNVPSCLSAYLLVCLQRTNRLKNRTTPVRLHFFPRARCFGATVIRRLLQRESKSSTVPCSTC